MSFRNYLKDKLYEVLLWIICYMIILLLFFAFKIYTMLIIVISVILFSLFISLLLIDYYRKKSFYDNLLFNVESLDKSYLVLETLSKPEFYDGELLYQVLYEINKSMNENVKAFESQLNDFKEYIEMWIHEVKIPLATLVLIINNNKEQIDRKLKNQLKRLEDYIDQVLYYVRSENAENDYLIKDTNLSNVIKNIAMKNMDDLLENHIEFNVEKIECDVLTDSKWLEFILNQIINNSIKYKRTGALSYIKISVNDEENKTVLMIEDNGIGIPKTDLGRVFNKTFTGENGRGKAKSTGMGLFIAKNLCQKLGHKIEIKSKQNEYTKVYITFSKNKFYDVTKNITKM